MLIAVGISAIVLAGGWAFTRNILSFNTTAYEGLSAQADLLKVMNVWSMELRTATVAENGAFPILEAGTNTLTFYSDIDDDGVVERVRYFLSGSKMRKGVIDPEGAPLSYVTSNESVTDQIQGVVNSATSIFQYFDSSYNGTASSTAPLSQPVNNSAIRLIKLTIEVDRDVRRPPGPVQVVTQAMLRNLKDNQ